MSGGIRSFLHMRSDRPQATQPHNPMPAISRLLAEDIDRVTAVLAAILDSDSPRIREVGAYIQLASGKKLRPIVTLLCARAFGTAPRPPVQVAAALEAIHVATLLHDDVIDKAPFRRGQPSVNARWGDDVAILMADYIFSAAFELSLEHLPPSMLRLICTVTRQMSEGEMFQIERRDAAITTDEYLHIVRCKTAWLFSACAALGGRHAGLEGEAVAELSSFGMEFGMAFQITDDTLDYTADDDQWGKEVGIDLAAGKRTLPLILALEAAPEDERTRVEAALNDGYDMNLVRDLVERRDGIARARETAAEFIRRAQARLESLQIRDPEARDLLTALCDFILARRY